ncbi:MAG: tetratricopeptide repeat protein, partial [Bryobacterales bacterium]|nr:tetratricopeptide repeat protein [Bryobacterales bacterium]
LEVAPGRASARKDLGYTYLKVGEPEAAREQFREAMRLDPADRQVALEYAFLCYETKRQAEARRVFDRLRKTGDAASRATAEQAFQNIDRPLREGIERWRKAVELTPGNFGAHYELARLAEERDELELAAEHYRRAWEIRPERRSCLLDLGRVWQALHRVEEAGAALLAASRGSEPRTAERARELLPSRYPYVYEFRRALELDPGNTELRRELAYLLLGMGRRQEAEQEFRFLSEKGRGDLLSSAQLGLLMLERQEHREAEPLLERVLEGEDRDLASRIRASLGLPPLPAAPPASAPAAQPVHVRELAERSFQAGYLQDALRYLRAAHDADPVDFSVMLKLGWTLNMLRNDGEAVSWFDLARRSPDPAISAEAERAYRNLRPGLARFRTTAWLFPFYSSRWRDVFSYGQVKTSLKLGNLPLEPYVSTRFAGDTRRTTGGALPQYLSESSFIFGIGLASLPWRGLTAWGEAGSAISYLGRRPGAGYMVPDYRGGIAFARAAGTPMGRETGGAFYETNADGVFVSRFGDDLLIYSQHRFGYTPRPVQALGGLETQLYWNANLTVDVRREYWANVAEFGPGVRLRWPAMPPSLTFSINFLRGVHLRNLGNPRGPNFYDFRAGFWYAFTR